MGTYESVKLKTSTDKSCLVQVMSFDVFEEI